MKQIFINRYNELRSGWRILIFFIVTILLVMLLTYPTKLIRELPFGKDIELSLDLAASVLILAGSLVSSYILTRFINRKPLAAIGLWFNPSSMKEFTGGLVVSILMMTAIAACLLAFGFVEMQTRTLSALDILSIIATSALFFAAGAMFEEVVFRGYAFQTLIQGVTLLPAIVLMGVFFAGAHMGNPNAEAFGIINIAFASAWLSIAYVKTRGLWLPFGLHFGWNFSQTVIFSFPTSGIEFAGRKLFVTSVSGPEWLTGGPFGPEGGALATVVLVAGSWYLLKTDRFSPPAGVITLDSVEDLIQAEQPVVVEKT